jgi:hypothetical protein
VLLRLPGPHHTHSLRLGFLLFVFFLSFSSSFFLFFCYCLVDTLLQNPLWMPDLFNEGRCFSCASTAAFIRSMFFPLPFLAADSIFAAGSMCRIPMFYFPSFFLPCARLAPSCPSAHPPSRVVLVHLFSFFPCCVCRFHSSCRIHSLVTRIW